MKKNHIDRSYIYKIRNKPNDCHLFNSEKLEDHTHTLKNIKGSLGEHKQENIN